jgi:hypothetical protein
MFLQRFDRLISLSVISGLVAWWLTIDIGSKHMMGKDAYLAYASAYFDRYYSRTFHPITSAIGYFFFIAAFYAIYEGIAFFIRRIGGSQPSRQG